MTSQDSRLHEWGWPLLVMVLGLVATVAVGWLQHRQNDHHIQQRLEDATERVVDQLYRRMHSYELGLLGAGGAVAAAGSSTAEVPRESFRRFAATVSLPQSFPGARGIGFVRRIPRQQEAQFVDDVHREYDPAFHIYEVTPDIGDPATLPLADRFVVQFIEPAQGNEGAQGLDLATGVHRRAALLAAMRDGAPRITRPLTLSQAPTLHGRGFLLFLALYNDGAPPPPPRREAATVGWTYMPLVIDEVLSGVDFERGSVTMALRDVTEASAPALFFSGLHWSAATPSVMSRRQTLEIFGRQWEIEVQALPVFVERLHLPSPAAMAAVVASFFVLLALLSAARLRHVHRVKQANVMREAALHQLRESEAKVRRTADLLEQLIESAPDPIWTKDVHGCWAIVNSAAAALLGRPRELIIGQRNHDVLPADYADVLDAQDQRILHEGVVLRTEDRTFDIGHGEPRVFYSIKVPLRAADGCITGMLGIARDITQRKAAEARLAEINTTLEQQVRQRTLELEAMAARERAIVASAGSAIITTDLSGTITSFNPAAQAKFRATAVQAIGRSILEFHDFEELRERTHELPTPLRERALGLIQGAPSSVRHPDTPPERLRHHTEWTYVRSDGTRFPGLLRLTLLRDTQGNVSGFLAMIADLSERRRMEDQLRQRTYEAEAANRAKSAFLAHMSHELRTPLNAVIGLSQLLAQKTLPDDVSRFIGHIHDAGEQLLALVNDVLDVSRFEAGEFHLEHQSFELLPLLDAVRALVQPQADAKDLELQLDAPPNLPLHVMGDSSRLKQIILNLVDNAIKFTPSGSVVLRVRELARDGAQTALRFEVADTGIGIEPEAQSRIFEPFTQAESYTVRRFGGTGLGLSIARRLVDMMSGQLELQSELGKGSTFSVTLTLDLPPS